MAGIVAGTVGTVASATHILLGMERGELEYFKSLRIVFYLQCSN